MRSHIWITNDSEMGHNAKVYYIDEHGCPTDISDCVQAASVNLRVGELNSATLNVIKVKFDAKVAADKLTVK